MFALIVETVVFITLHTRRTYLRGAVTGITSILPIKAIQSTIKATSLIVESPGDQTRRKTFQARGRICAVLTPSQALLAV
jgi:hypothetical protein